MGCYRRCVVAASRRQARSTIMFRHRSCHVVTADDHWSLFPCRSHHQEPRDLMHASKSQEEVVLVTVPSTRANALANCTTTDRTDCVCPNRASRWVHRGSMVWCTWFTAVQRCLSPPLLILPCQLSSSRPRHGCHLGTMCAPR